MDEQRSYRMFTFGKGVSSRQASTLALTWLTDEPQMMTASSISPGGSCRIVAVRCNILQEAFFNIVSNNKGNNSFLLYSKGISFISMSCKLSCELQQSTPRSTSTKAITIIRGHSNTSKVGRCEWGEMGKLCAL